MTDWHLYTTTGGAGLVRSIRQVCALSGRRASDDDAARLMETFARR